MLESIANGLDLALVWVNFPLIALGVVVGVSFAAIPGLTGPVAISLLLPFTYFLSPVAAMGLLLGAYKGTMFGGSISAITFGIPGDTPATATVLDGFPLAAKQRKPYVALHTALYSSAAGNLVADLVVIFTFVPLGVVALKFGPRELFALMCLAMTTLLVFSEGGIYKALVGVMIGFFLATIGTDPIINIPRLTFGIRELEAGIPLVPFAVGLFAFTEMLAQYRACFSKRTQTGVPDADNIGSMIRRRSPEDRLTVREWLTYWREMLIGFGIGISLGALPGPGGTMSAFTSYALGGSLSKNEGKYGIGVPEGVASAEAGNSATVGPTLIPLFAFGIPGSGTAGIFMGAFMMQGITPGPALFTDHVEVMLAVFMMMLVGTLFNLVISKLFLIPVFARLGSVNPRILVPVLVPMMVIGMYAISIRPFDIVVLVGAGLLGLAMRRFKIPLAPTIVAFMIGPMFEKHLKRGLILSGGNLSYWFTSPIALGLYAGAIVAVILLIRRARRSRVSA